MLPTINVQEWCDDWFGLNEYKQYASQVAIDPHGPKGAMQRVVRGGDCRDYERCRSAYRTGVAADDKAIPCPETMKPGLTEGDKRLLAHCLNLARRHIDAKTKRLIIADQLRETPDKSDRWIGKMLGVDGKTVADVRRELESGAEIPHVAVKVGQDGKRYPNEKASTHHPHDDEPTNTTQVDKGSASTPLWLFDFCNRLAISICGKPFSVDLAADHWNKKCDHFFTETGRRIRAGLG